MSDFSPDQIKALLLDAEQRLLHSRLSASTPNGSAYDITKPFQAGKSEATMAGNIASNEKLSVRVPLLGQEANKLLNSKDTTGPEWFSMPKTNPTPEFKRDWQLLRMRSLLDPKHQKKSLHKHMPEYSQVGEVVLGAAEPYNARLTRRERKRTMLEEVMSRPDGGKLKSKFVGIQHQKASGRKKFYKQLVSKRRKRS